MKRTLVAAVAVLMVAGLAFAGGPGRGMMGNSGSAPQMGGGLGPGGHGEGMGGPGGGLFVGSDGTLYVEKVAVDSASNTATTQLTAIKSTGATAWTISVAGRGGFRLSGSLLLSVSEVVSSDNTTVTSTLTAYSTATGSVAWTKTLSGHVGELIPFSGGTYAIVGTPPATTGGTGSRSVVAIGGDGATLWTVALP